MRRRKTKKARQEIGKDKRKSGGGKEYTKVGVMPTSYNNKSKHRAQSRPRPAAHWPV
jgi:hypothetical protein